MSVLILGILHLYLVEPMDSVLIGGEVFSFQGSPYREGPLYNVA